MNCRYCGSPLPADVKFCSNCGRSQQEDDNAGTSQEVSSNGTPPPIPGAPIQAQTGKWIGAGWQMVKSEIGLFCLMSIVFLVMNGCVPLILQGPLMAGFHIACIRKLMRGRLDIGDLFKGFGVFGASLLAFLIIGFFSFLGSLLCIIPGLVIAAMYQFTYLFIVDKKMDFWPAMQASHAIVKKDYFGFTLFFVALVLLNIAGVLLCLIGVLLTLPICYAAITVAYQDLVGFENKENF